MQMTTIAFATGRPRQINAVTGEQRIGALCKRVHPRPLYRFRQQRPPSPRHDFPDADKTIDAGMKDAIGITHMQPGHKRLPVTTMGRCVKSFGGDVDQLQPAIAIAPPVLIHLPPTDAAGSIVENFQLPF